MEEIRVNWLEMGNCGSGVKQCQGQIAEVISAVRQTRNAMQWQMKIQLDIAGSLSRNIDDMQKLQQKMGRLASVLDDAISAYKAAEVGNSGSDGSDDGTDSVGSFSAGGGAGGGSGGGGGRAWDAATGGAIGGVGVLAGLTGTDATSDNGGWETVGWTKWEIDEGNVSFFSGSKIENCYAEETYSEEYGDLTSDRTVQVLTGAVTGGVGASLYEDGIFAPSVYGEVKMDGSVLHGEGETRYGDETMNGHAQISGDVLSGELSGKIGAGKLVVVDEYGNTTTAYGVRGEVNAEAYVFQGEISGGFTLFGIDFDVKLEGKALGAGVNADVEATTNGVGGSIGAGLGIGGGIDFNIDWSDFEAPDLSSWFRRLLRI